MHFIVKYKLILIGVLVGAIGGYAYYHFIGCISGTCVITSKPLNSTLYGAMMGGLLFSSYQNNNSNTKKTKSDDNG